MVRALLARRVLHLAAVTSLLASCKGSAPLPTTDDQPPTTGGQPREETTLPAITCRAPIAPPAFQLVDRFPGIRFDGPLAISRVGRDWLVATQKGVVVRVVEADGAYAALPFLDLGAALGDDAVESGLVGFVASPDYGEKPEVFAVYTGRSDVPGSVYRLVYARFTSRDGGATVDPASEEILFTIEREMSGHNGGRMVFGPDRLLYIGVGDGSWGDPLQRAQDPASLFGKVLRLDVLGLAQPTPEVFALGFRNPWSFSFDPAGRLWLGDVGHEAYEEINIVTKGGNYGWPLREGRRCFAQGPQPCDLEGAIDPVHEYAHADGLAVTGGYVYRGHQPALAGLYVFGDFMTGRLSALDAANPGDARLLLDSGRFISAFGEDADGELLVVDFGGQVLRLEALAPDRPEEDASLRSLGCLDDPLLRGYDVNAPLWTDGLTKRRWIGLPGQPARVGDDGSLDLPAGTLFLKELSWQGQRVETRMLTKSPSGDWLGYTFEWNETQTDAVLLREGKTIALGDAPWTIPSRAQCAACHRRTAGTVLGFTPPQLARGAQLASLTEAGVFDRAPDPTRFTALVDPYDPAAGTVEERARSYLGANCGHCHGATGNSAIDLRPTTPLAQTFTLCWPAMSSFEVGATERRSIVHPGDAARSVLVERMNRADSSLMPPLGRARIDTAAVDLVSEWIDAMTACE